jgi:amidohydrolase
MMDAEFHRDVSDSVRDSIRAAVRMDLASQRDRTLRVSHTICDLPELAYEENSAVELLCGELRTVAGVRVTQGIGPLTTAFLAETGTGELVVTLCAEYDALPGVGHACGHNVIAAAAFGAFLAVAPHTTKLGITLRLLGTPAEERGGGKVDLLRMGAFDGTHAAMMIHPIQGDVSYVTMPTLASTAFRVTYAGVGAHASAEPWAGANAMDAITLASTAIALARQQLAPGQQVHGYIKEAGSASNIIPDSASGEWMVRAESMDSLRQLSGVAMRCFEAGAHATGTTLSVHRFEHPYSAMTPDHGLAAAFFDNAKESGRSFEMRSESFGGSTDMANVSNYFPAIHPVISLGADAPDIHTAPFAHYARGSAGDTAVDDGARLLALTTIDISLDSSQRTRLLTRPVVDARSAGEELGEPVRPYESLPSIPD